MIRGDGRQWLTTVEYSTARTGLHHLKWRLELAPSVLGARHSELDSNLNARFAPFTMAFRTFIPGVILLLLIAESQAHVGKGGGDDHAAPASAAASAPASITTLDELVKVAGAGDFDADTSDFDVLFYLINTVDLATVGAAAAGAPFTLFAPTDAAFIQTAKDLALVGDYADEAAAATAIATALSKKGDLKELVTTILNYHIATEALDSKGVLAKMEIKTFADGLTIKRGQYGVEMLELTDNAPSLPNAKIIKTDIKAFSGFIHAIDRVLLPIALGGGAPKPEMKTIKTVDELVKFAGAGDFDADVNDFDVLFYLINLVELPTFDAAAKGAAFTLFAPTDAAFIQTAKDLGLLYDVADEAAAATAIAHALGNMGDLTELVTTILNYHIATEKLDSTGVINTTEIKTFAEGLTIKRGQHGVDMLELTDNAPALPNAKIIKADIKAFNGVIHVVNRVLLPIALGE